MQPGLSWILGWRPSHRLSYRGFGSHGQTEAFQLRLTTQRQPFLIASLHQRPLMRSRMISSLWWALRDPWLMSPWHVSFLRLSAAGT